MTMKKVILLFLFIGLTGPVFAQTPLPSWLYEVLAAEETLFPGGAPQNWYAARRHKEETFEKLCYDQLMKEDSPFVQNVKRQFGARADSQLISLYALIKGRREWLQLETRTGKIFLPYAVVASNPADLADLDEESFLRLRNLMKGDFDDKTRFTDRVERTDTAVFVWPRDWTPEDRVIRLSLEVKEKLLDICLNDCEDYPFL